ncbi:SAF domain-containing protein [Nocardia sp. 348MFTsu5.1]|uniref:SAF domain-containing protein n=1 Tax=Nocardia sp. 348MFTsu5.1 TaxID=1172185 RepID=UPI000374C09C|nr:SAF domain-containing protein [Nocardia sp. 348MFTsu5.1]
MPDRNPLSPTAVDRLRHALRPGWTRSLLVRRACAVALLVVAVVAALTAHRDDELQSVVVAARELAPGVRLTSDDLDFRTVDATAIPTGAITDPAQLVEQTVTGPVHPGEMFTDTRILSSRLPAALLGRDDARLVPVTLSDSSVVDLLREGDVVDVLSINEADSDDASSSPSVLAKNAVVALVYAPSSTRSGRDARPVILAMPEHDAHRVAGATLAAPITVVFH